MVYSDFESRIFSLPDHRIVLAEPEKPSLFKIKLIIALKQLIWI